MTIHRRPGDAFSAAKIAERCHVSLKQDLRSGVWQSGGQQGSKVLMDSDDIKRLIWKGDA